MSGFFDPSRYALLMEPGAVLYGSKVHSVVRNTVQYSISASGTDGVLSSGLGVRNPLKSSKFLGLQSHSHVRYSRR